MSDAQKPEIRSTTHNSERPVVSLTSLVAIVLSLCALLVSVLEVSAIRDESRYQVWPFIAVGEHYSGDGFSITIENKGVGPARIRDIETRLDGQVYHSLDELIVDSVGAEDAFSYELYQSSDPLASVMSADEQVLYFGVPWEARTRKLSEAWSKRLAITICYCSVYDDCWTVSMDEREPTAVDRCPRDTRS